MAGVLPNDKCGGGGFETDCVSVRCGVTGVFTGGSCTEYAAMRRYATGKVMEASW